MTSGTQRRGRRDDGSRHHRRVRSWAAALGVALVAVFVPAGGAVAAPGDHDLVRDMTWPLGEVVPIRDDYDAGRSGGTDECRAQGVAGRIHQANDLMAPKMTPVHAAVGGEVTFAPEAEPSYGWIVVVTDDAGVRWSYLHLNDDTPGTDDGQGGIDLAIAPDVRRGARVERGQLLGWVGDSGSAESTGSHLHLSIVDPELDDPQLVCPHVSTRVNPYPSLVAALERGDLPGSITPLGGPGVAVPDEPGPDAPDGPTTSAPWPDVDTGGVHAGAIAALAELGVLDGCADDAFCPEVALARRDMARFIGRARELEPTVADFLDVLVGDADLGWIGALVDAGIADGLGDGTFDPDGTVTRGQMARFLVQAHDLPPATAPAQFDDVLDDGVFRDDVAALVAAGVTNGCGDGTSFCVAEPVTRGQVASFLQRAAAAAPAG